MLKRILVMGAVASVILGVGAGAAGADPVNAKKGQVVPVECDNGLGSLMVAVNGNAEITPGHVVGSTQVLVPYAIHEEQSFTPTGGATDTEVVDIVKPAPHNGRLATCTFHFGGSTPEGVFTVDGTVWVSYSKTR